MIKYCFLASVMIFVENRNLFVITVRSKILNLDFSKHTYLKLFLESWFYAFSRTVIIDKSWFSKHNSSQESHFSCVFVYLFIFKRSLKITKLSIFSVSYHSWLTKKMCVLRCIDFKFNFKISCLMLTAVNYNTISSTQIYHHMTVDSLHSDIHQNC